MKMYSPDGDEVEVDSAQMSILKDVGYTRTLPKKKPVKTVADGTEPTKSLKKRPLRKA